MLESPTLNELKRIDDSISPSASHYISHGWWIQDTNQFFLQPTMMVFRSMRMGTDKRMIKMRWGIMSAVGTGIGNCVKTGSKAVTIGTANRMFDE